MTAIGVWIEPLAYAFAIGSFSYSLLVGVLSIYADRAIKRGRKIEGLPDIWLLNPKSMLVLYLFIYSKNLNNVSDRFARLLLSALRIVVLPTFLAAIVLFVLLVVDRAPPSFWNGVFR